MKKSQTKRVVLWIDELNLSDYSQQYIELTTVTNGNPWHALNRLVKRYERNCGNCAYAIETARFELMEEN